MKTNDGKINKLALHGLFTAIIAVLTLFASIPLPVGSGGAYLNAGDAAVFTAAFALGPFGGAVAAAVGSALADVLHGALIYAPATLVIKGLMALIAGLIFKRSRLEKGRTVLAPAVGGLVMPAGYFVYELLLYGLGTALYGLWTNAIQYAFGVAAGAVIVAALKKTVVLERFGK